MPRHPLQILHIYVNCRYILSCLLRELHSGSSQFFSTSDEIIQQKTVQEMRAKQGTVNYKTVRDQTGFGAYRLIPDDIPITISRSS